jgi:hypothetical protein
MRKNTFHIGLPKFHLLWQHKMMETTKSCFLRQVLNVWGQWITLSFYASRQQYYGIILNRIKCLLLIMTQILGIKKILNRSSFTKMVLMKQSHLTGKVSLMKTQQWQLTIIMWAEAVTMKPYLCNLFLLDISTDWGRKMHLIWYNRFYTKLLSFCSSLFKDLTAGCWY